MKIKYFTFLIIICFSLVLFRCKEDNNIINSANDAPGFLGKVVDRNGIPVDSADIHFIFSLSNHQAHLSANKQIQFAIPQKSFVKLQTSRWYTRQLVETVVNDTLLSGYYSYSLQSQKYTNGLYHVNLSAGSFTQEKYIFALDTNIISLIATTPFCRSNEKGLFDLPWGSFGFGVPIILVSEINGTILDTVYVMQSLQVVVYKNGYNVLLNNVSVDTTKAMHYNFQFN